MAEFKFEVVENVGVLSQKSNGWKRELNFVSWNEREPKMDIRDWNPEHTRMGKGVTLTEEEARILYELLKEEFDQ